MIPATAVGDLPYCWGSVKILCVRRFQFHPVSKPHRADGLPTPRLGLSDPTPLPRTCLTPPQPLQCWLRHRLDAATPPARPGEPVHRHGIHWPAGDLRPPAMPGKRLIQRVRAEINQHGDRHLPCRYPSPEPVHHRREIDEAASRPAPDQSQRPHHAADHVASDYLQADNQGATHQSIA
jgi:hypothetical protein